MWQLLWLLLPLAALSGWWIGRKSTASRPSPPSLPADYFQGLNYLLNEQPDRAIEVFTRLVEVDSETVETHLTLGNLFRRRGEADRAVRIHQNLIARPSLAPDQRAGALLELGRDYLAAGLLDRAETLFLEAVEFPDFRVTALQCLLDIYQQENEWESAIDIAQRLQRTDGRNLQTEMAQFACEQAERLRRQHADPMEIRQVLRRAMGFDRNCVRASLLISDLEQEEGRWRAAIKACQQVSVQDPDYVPEMLPRLEAGYQALDERRVFRQELNRLFERQPAVSVIIKLSELIEADEGRSSAVEFLATQLRARPSVRGLNRLVELNIDAGDADQRRQRDLQVLRELLQALLANRLPYRCVECGFEGRQLHWQCPGCRSWASIKPRRGPEGE
ncbi:lipopolysaccharide assembly protein LapB [Spiribacter vilamensis]|uniref:Lipopolysaccharide assembly protein B n=1 Tax=Spiribacter vilamensis TaxID=531306 RepID=A0A4Q8D0J3_9GAMM|nr:lipopolysaccharide assembly protein LapB [Spiribacter vilamensis]RZU98813.1 lipopolysaccharide biosynthesis regulator YciM [Spiribacter vilamensis]TVO62167.1 lipopolysaccharide assembly protein LapB [Spiribacter vilamensis]